MTEYKAQSNGIQTFELSQNDKLIGTLTYDSWLSTKSSIVLADNSNFRLDPKGFWGTNIEITANETVLIRVKLNWDSEDAVITNFGDEEQNVVFEYIADSLIGSYIVTDGENRKLLVIKPISSWSELDYSFDITASEHFENVGNKELVIMTAVYLANYHLSMSMATAIMFVT